MSRSFKTSLFILFVLVNKLILSFVWDIIFSNINLSLQMNLILSQLLSFILPMVVYFILTKESVIDVLSLHPISYENVILIIVISIFIQPFMSLLGLISTFLFQNNISQVVSNVNEGNMFYTILVIGIIPGFCEELIFRGIIFSGFRNRGFYKAAIMSGLYFGLMHLDGQQFLYAFAMGIVFCYMVYKTNSIFSSIISHFTINSSQTLLLKLQSIYIEKNNIDMSIVSETTVDIPILLLQMGIIVVFTLPILIFCFYMLNKINKPVSNIYDKIQLKDDFTHSEILFEEPYDKPKDKLLNIPFFIFIAIYLIIVILPIIPL